MNYSMDIVPILIAMEGKSATCKAFALTVEEIHALVLKGGDNLSRYTVHKCVNQLFKGGILEHGFYRCRSFTYYIGEKGREFYKKELG